jgi:hypothetical protein
VNDHERFEQAIEKLLADRSPRSEMTCLSEEEQRMIRMAQLLRGRVRMLVGRDRLSRERPRG